MIAGCRCRSFGARTLSPSGPRAARDGFAPRPACSRMPPNWVMMEGSDGGALATPGRGALGVCGVDVRPPSDWEISSKKPATDCSVRALQLSRCWRYAGDLPDMSNRFRAVNKLQKIR